MLSRATEIQPQQSRHNYRVADRASARCRVTTRAWCAARRRRPPTPARCMAGFYRGAGNGPFPLFGFTQRWRRCSARHTVMVPQGAPRRRARPARSAAVGFTRSGRRAHLLCRWTPSHRSYRTEAGSRQARAECRGNLRLRSSRWRQTAVFLLLPPYFSGTQRAGRAALVSMPAAC